MLKLDTTSLSYFGAAAFLMDVDSSGIPIYSVVNQKWCEGAQRFSKDVVGKTAKEVFGGVSGVAAYAQHLSVIKSGEQETYELALPVNDKNHVVRTTLTPIRNESGRIAQLLGVSIDKTAETTGASLQARVEAAGADMENFIAMAAHDLRAPMRNVQSLANLLREDFVDQGDGKLELIDILESVALKATDLVTDILAHAEATGTISALETFDIAELSKNIFVVLDPLSKHRLSADTQKISSDKGAIQIALRNLCENAIKHCGNGAVDLLVKVCAIEDGFLEISVCDNGIGFRDPAVAFLSGGRMRVDSGFGLLGVRKLIASRGGSIRAENRTDADGSIVSFTMQGHLLPAAQTPVLPIAANA